MSTTTPGADETRPAATWGEAVSGEEIAAIEGWLGAPLPDAWKTYLHRDRWLRNGWLKSGEFITLESPDEARSLMEAWNGALELHPGFYRLGTDGSRSIYCIDLRDITLGVIETDITAGGWNDAESLGISIEEFVGQIDDGTFSPHE